MTGIGYAIFCIVCMLISAILQYGVAPSMSIGLLSPDFLLVTSSVLCLTVRPGTGAGTGFLAGLIQGALAGANITHYVVSRAVSGFLLSWSRDSGLEFGTAATSIAVMIATVGARLIFMFFAAPPDIGAFLQATILMALYNGVIAVPTSILLYRWAKPKKV